MKITGMQFFVVDADWRDWIFVKIITDEGVTGVGEATLPGQESAVVAILHDIKSYLLGKDPFQIENHWRNLYYSCFFQGVVFLAALGGVEMALWDILGKTLNVPVYTLLGGPCRYRVRCYTHISEETSGHSIEQRVEEAQAAVAEGWTALKWDPLPANFLTLNSAQMSHVVRQVQAVREAVGDDIELLIECHGRLDATTAIQLAREIAPLRPLFIEEPTHPENLDVLAKVAAHSPVPLAVGERVFTASAFWEILDRHLVSYIQPDVIFVGGLLPCKKIAALAEARSIGVAPHNPHGPVCTAATLHLVANLPHFSIQEMPADDYLWSASWRDEVLIDPEPVRVRQGYLELPTAPGFGIELNETAIARYPPRVRPWGVSFRADSAIID
ncbi:galactonate dehydratase [Roseiflexus sp.]|uniref:galactonate dehydratase n=1 Tax=Roseiflexus sp. TaxID=2562120 RepID=UPI00398B29B8